LSLAASRRAASPPHPPSVGCFVCDLDSNKIEATFWDFDLARKHGTS
jgi:hypothetical protein